MRRRDFLAGALALGASTAVAQPAQPVMPLHEAPRDLVSPAFIDGEGLDLTLADFKGRVVLLNIWATWCVPCRVEMPMLDRLQARLGGEDFHVLPLSIDRAGLKPVQKFYKEIEIKSLGIYLAQSLQVMQALGVVGLPTTLLIDRDGREIARLVGPAEWDSPEAIAQFKTVISRRRN